MRLYDDQYWTGIAREAGGVVMLAIKRDGQSKFQVVRAPNVFLLLLKIIFSWKPKIPRRTALKAILTDLLLDLGLLKI